MNKELEKVSINLNGTDTDVINLSPQSERELALVDLTVIQRLASLLPKADIWCIKDNFISRIKDTSNMEEFVTELAEELAFQTSVNLITTMTMKEIHPEPVVQASFESRDPRRPEEICCC